VLTGRTFTFDAIGVVHSPFTEKVKAPRQARARAAEGVAATIELFEGKGFEHALEDVGTWERLWIVFVFDRVTGWRAKVQPPRSDRKRGLFSTRSPHRPNPIGLSAVRLVKVEGLVLHVRDIDILDGTPVLDIKPYVPYADAFPAAGSGWLAPVSDPVPEHPVVWAAEAHEEVEWLAARGVALKAPVEQALALGPRPNAYRRIRRADGVLELAVKDWRIRFEVDEVAETFGASTLLTPRPPPPLPAVRVLSIATGYRPRELAMGESSAPLDLARAFLAAFGRHLR
jgi:tRNA-Thr(GGU) m(6)t(6)A37 methyltransferase TsaA